MARRSSAPKARSSTVRPFSPASLTKAIFGSLVGKLNKVAFTPMQNIKQDLIGRAILETVFVDNTPLKPVDALSKVVPGTFYFDYAADKIYIADNPIGHTIEAGKLADAFHGSATNVTVQNLVIEKYDPTFRTAPYREARVGQFRTMKSA